MAADQATNDQGTADDTSGADTVGGFCIEICVTANGKITVSSEPLSEEQGEGSGTPVDNIDDALAEAKKLYEAGGAIEDEDQASFDAGFGKGPGAQSMIREGE